MKLVKVMMCAVFFLCLLVGCSCSVKNVYVGEMPLGMPSAGYFHNQLGHPHRCGNCY